MPSQVADKAEQDCIVLVREAEDRVAPNAEQPSNLPGAPGSVTRA